MFPTIDLHNNDNLNAINILRNQGIKFDFIYSDMIYEDKNFLWVDESLPLLSDNGVYVVQTDYHTVAEMKLKLDSTGLLYNSWCIYINDWGGTPKKGFPRKHDDILIYTRTKDYKWYPDRIQIPKATAGTRFDKKGTGLKTPPDVFYDHASFSTMAKERVIFKDKNIQWQKPIWLARRLMYPFLDKNDSILDLFMGSGTFGVVAAEMGCNYTGIELYTDIFGIATKRIVMRKA